MFKKSLIAAVVALSSFSAMAAVTCQTNSFGQTQCYGTDQSGQQVNTTTQINSFGQTNTYGTVGGRQVQQTCSTNSFGQTTCY